MFDISIPIMCDSASGRFTTVIWHDDDCESSPISLVEGFGISDLMEYWLNECFALVINKTRKRGFLPMLINYDVDSRLGCLEGYGVILDDGKVHITDERVFRKTCSCDPLKWWKCVDSRKFKVQRASRWIVPEKDFLAWVYRLESVMHARDCVIDNLAYDREIMDKNSEVLSKVLNDVAGGREFLSILPRDWTERDRVICRSGPHGRGKRIKLSECPGATAGFDEEVAEPRDNEEVAWWIKREFLRDGIVVFMCPQGTTKSGMSVSVVRPSDVITKILQEILEKTRIDSEAVDHVAFSARCDLEELKSGGNHVILSRSKFRTLLKGARRVLLGVCKGTAWSEFPLGKIERQSSMPLFTVQKTHTYV